MAKRTINAKEIWADIKAAMDNAALMEKYHLTDKSIQSVFKKLTDVTNRQIALLQMVKEAKQRIEQKGLDLSAKRQAQASSTKETEKESEKQFTTWPSHGQKNNRRKGNSD
jgi:hypothetical protein